MCDEITEKENIEYLRKRGDLSRRDFGRISIGAGLSAIMLPKVAGAADVTESDVNITTPDGTADCYFVHPSSGKHAAVLIWPDIFGLRPAFQAMGKRLAESGYSVLVVNPFYRHAKVPVFEEGADFAVIREKVGPMRAAMTQEAIMSDAKSFVDFLDKQASVDTSRKMGTTGYCMGGPLVMWTVAALPDRMGAGATFHGGGLATDQDDSPHLLIPQTKAQMLHAIAENDDERTPEAKNMLREAYEKAGIKAEIEVYKGTNHGWCPPDSRVYNEDMAEKAWARMLVLFEEALA